MLDIYQRESEKVRPQFFYTANAKRGQDVPLIAQEDGETCELVEIEISDDETATVFYTVAGAPPVFISLRPGEPLILDDIPEMDAGTADPETVLSVPDDTPGILAEQLAAAQLESALSAVEALAPDLRESLRRQFGLAELGQPGAGSRALRPTDFPPVLPLSVKVRYAGGAKEEYTLSADCPALFLDVTDAGSSVALAGTPAAWAVDLFRSAAQTWEYCSRKKRKRLCAEFGIDMSQFLRRIEELKNNISDR